MAKAVIIYESKYGNTKTVAECIAESMKEANSIETAVYELKTVKLDELVDYDMILIGSPNHMGSATRGIRKFIDGLGKLNLQGKWVACFDTCIGRDFEKAMKKMEKQVGEKVPGLTLVAPGLSIRVDGMKGPITEGELPKCKDYGVKITNLMKE